MSTYWRFVAAVTCWAIWLLAAPGPEDDGRLAGLDQKGEDLGQLGRA